MKLNMSKRLLPSINKTILKKSNSTTALQRSFGIPKPVK